RRARGRSVSGKRSHSSDPGRKSAPVATSSAVPPAVRRLFCLLIALLAADFAWEVDTAETFKNSTSAELIGHAVVELVVAFVVLRFFLLLQRQFGSLAQAFGDRKIALERLSHEAAHDPLTNLPN